MGFLNIFVAASAEDSARDRLDADVLAELHHHLDAAAADLVTAGLDPEEAAREARRRFGKLEPVRRRCLHLQTGGHAMLHKLHLAFTCLLTVAVVGFAFQNLMLYRKSLAAEEMARARMDELQVTLRALLVQEAPPTEQQVYVQIGDELQIVDLHNDEVSATKRVAVDGMVLVRPVGWVHVAGMTRQEVEALLTKKLSDYYVLSEITVEVLPRREPAPVEEFTETLFEDF